jgi:hypothetical protein
MGTERLVRRTAYTPGGTALRRCDAPGSGAQQQARRERVARVGRFMPTRVEGAPTPIGSMLRRACSHRP